MPRNKTVRAASGYAQQHAALRMARFLAGCSPEQQALLQQMVQVRRLHAATVMGRTGKSR